MFEVGFTEIILILGIALVVLGPEKLPRVASEIGRWLGRARAMARQLKMQLDEETLKVEQPWMQQRKVWQPPGDDASAPAAEPTADPEPAAGSAAGPETPAEPAAEPVVEPAAAAKDPGKPAA